MATMQARALVLALVSGVCAGAATTAAAETPFALSAVEAPLPPQDLRFLDEAHLLHASQQAAASLALQRSRDVRVRQYARRLLRDHAAARLRLERLAAARRILFAAPSPRAPLVDYGLAGLRGAPFDRQFVAAVGIAAHRAAVAGFQQQAERGRDAELLRFAGATLPLLSRHLASAEALDTQFELRRRNFSDARGESVDEPRGGRGSYTLAAVVLLSDGGTLPGRICSRQPDSPRIAGCACTPLISESTRAPPSVRRVERPGPTR